jgi:large-conductance mechanosensitive channel
MFNIVLAIVFGVVGIGLGVGYNLLVIKHYPDQGRKGSYVLAVFLFLICAMVLFCVVSLRPGINKTIAQSVTEMEQYINETHSSNGFVRRGLDLKVIGGDASQTYKAVSEIKPLLPTAQQIGLPNLVYNIAVDKALTGMLKNLTGVNVSEKGAGDFANEDNVITVASLTGGIQKKAINLVNMIFLVIAAIFAVLFIIYIIKSLLTMRKARKSKAT